jgi:hypothetical protein
MADQLVHEVNQTPAGLGPGAQKPTRAGPGRIARNITGSIVSDADEPRSHNACSNDSDGVARRDHPRGVRHKVKSHGLMRVTHHPKPAAPKVLARSVRGCSSLSSHPGDGAGGNHGRMLCYSNRTLRSRCPPMDNGPGIDTDHHFDRSFTTKERPPACFEVL